MTEGEMQGGPQAFAFAAQPQLRGVPLRKYRADPYHELVKIAPQNLMSDRRVVKGNTYAAMVIPVNLQPDPHQLEKEAMREFEKRKQQEFFKRKNMEEELKNQAEELHDQHRKEEMDLIQPWDLLEEDGVDVINVDPDFYIDRPPEPEFIPNPVGRDKFTQLEEYDLFDYDMEVEPILQVIVGKTLEQARIEVIEDHEKEELTSHLNEYQLLREAELMEAHRLEGERVRKDRENIRRDLQQMTAKEQRVKTQEKLVARLIGKKFLSGLKWGSYRVLRDQGILRDSFQAALLDKFVPYFQRLIYTKCKAGVTATKFMDELVSFGMSDLANTHDQAIEKEYSRRRKVQDDIKQGEEDKITAALERKEMRAKRREEVRIENLKQSIIDSMLSEAEEFEDVTKYSISDIRPFGAGQYIYTTGGLIGEMIIVLSKLKEYISTNPAFLDFSFDTTIVQNFVKKVFEDLLKGETNKIDLNLRRETPEMQLEESPTEEQLSAMIGKVFAPENIQNTGLSHLIASKSKLKLDEESVNCLLKAIMSIILFKPQELLEAEDMNKELAVGDDDALSAAPSGHDKEDLSKRNDLSKMNEERDKVNKQMTAVKTKIKMVTGEELPQEREAAIVILHAINKFHQDEDHLGTSEDSKIEQSISKIDQSANKEKESNKSIEKSFAGGKKRKEIEAKIAALPEEDRFKYLASSSINSSISIWMLHKLIQRKLRRVLINSGKKVLVKELEGIGMENILVEIEEINEELEEEVLGNIRKSQKYMGKPLPLFDLPAPIIYAPLRQTVEEEPKEEEITTDRVHPSPGRSKPS